MKQEESTSRPYVCSNFQQKGQYKIQQNLVKELGRDTQRLGLLGTCNTAKVGLRQLERVPRNTRNKEQICPFQASNGVAKN